MSTYLLPFMNQQTKVEEHNNILTESFLTVEPSSEDESDSEGGGLPSLSPVTSDGGDCEVEEKKSDDDDDDSVPPRLPSLSSLPSLPSDSFFRFSSSLPHRESILTSSSADYVSYDMPYHRQTDEQTRMSEKTKRILSYIFCFWFCCGFTPNEADEEMYGIRRREGENKKDNDLNFFKDIIRKIKKSVKKGGNQNEYDDNEEEAKMLPPSRRHSLLLRRAEEGLIFRSGFSPSPLNS